MKIKFCALLVGASLLALASSGNAAQPLSNSQMDGVTAGANWFATAVGTAAAFGNFDATTSTTTNSFASQLEKVAIGQSVSVGEAASAVTASYLAVGSQSTSACVGC